MKLNKTGTNGMLASSGTWMLISSCLLFFFFDCHQTKSLLKNEAVKLNTNVSKSLKSQHRDEPTNNRESATIKGAPNGRSGLNRKILNEIEFEASGGLLLEQAFLTDGQGQLVAAGNFLRSGEKFNIMCLVEH